MCHSNFVKCLNALIWVNGWSKQANNQASVHTHAQWSHTSAGLAQSHPNKSVYILLPFQLDPFSTHLGALVMVWGGFTEKSLVFTAQALFPIYQSNDVYRGICTSRQVDVNSFHAKCKVYIHIQFIQTTRSVWKHAGVSHLSNETSE